MRSAGCLLFRDGNPDAVGKSARIAATSSSGRLSTEDQRELDAV